MFRRAALLVILTLFVTIQSAPAQQKPPATAPSTQVAADQSTPQGTYILFLRASQTGNSAAARGLLYSSNPDQARLSELLLRVVEQNYRFRNAVIKAFGEAVADQFTGSKADETELVQAISRSKVVIDKTNATLQLDIEARPVQFVQTDGKWQMSIMDLADDKATSVLLNILKEVTDDLEQGKFKTEAELISALRSKSAAARMAAAEAAATQPATPAPRP